MNLIEVLRLSRYFSSRISPYKLKITRVLIPSRLKLVSPFAITAKY